MKRISIRPVWTIQDSDPARPPLPARLLELLVQVQAEGSLTGGAQRLNLSYRHAWDLVRQGEAHFGATLLKMERGKGSTLSPLGEKLVWADHRIAARLSPVLASLASELETEIGRVLAQAPAAPLRIQASHGFAIEALVERLVAQGVAIERRYVSSTAAVAALHEGACDVASGHLPVGPLQQPAFEHYRRWLGREDLRVIDVAQRWQGLMVAAGNPRKVHDLADLARPGVHFVNRQPDSGTRFVLELMLAQRGIDTAAIAGFEQGEFTHAAVAAFVASGMADAGFGLEPPARRFGLDFIPLVNERYFLLCHQATVDSPGLQAILHTLADPAFRAVVEALPGYRMAPAQPPLPLRQAFAVD